MQIRAYEVFYEKADPLKRVVLAENFEQALKYAVSIGNVSHISLLQGRVECATKEIAQQVY